MLRNTLTPCTTWWSGEIDGVDFLGIVSDIEVGTLSKKILYLVKYTDGDLQHMLEREVKGLLVPEDEPLGDEVCEWIIEQIALKGTVQCAEERW